MKIIIVLLLINGFRLEYEAPPFACHALQEAMINGEQIYQRVDHSRVSEVHCYARSDEEQTMLGWGP